MDRKYRELEPSCQTKTAACRAAAGLGATWLFRKARILAIFDDLDTVLLMIPLKMLMVGLAWQLGLIVVVMVAMLAIAYLFLHKLRIPVTWPWATWRVATSCSTAPPRAAKNGTGRRPPAH